MLEKFTVAIFLLLLASPALAAASFRIVVMGISPNPAEEGETPTAEVVVKNQGSSMETCYLELKAFDEAALEMDATSDNKDISPNGGEKTFTLSLDAGTWPAGNYSVVAKACTDAACSNVQDQRTKTLTIARSPPQPILESSPLLPPIIALSALAFLFLSRKRRS